MRESESSTLNYELATKGKCFNESKFIQSPTRLKELQIFYMEHR